MLWRMVDSGFCLPLPLAQNLPQMHMFMCVCVCVCVCGEMVNGDILYIEV